MDWQLLAGYGLLLVAVDMLTLADWILMMTQL